jgi:hypothetical protein
VSHGRTLVSLCSQIPPSPSLNLELTLDHWLESDPRSTPTFYHPIPDSREPLLRADVLCRVVLNTHR